MKKILYLLSMTIVFSSCNGSDNKYSGNSNSDYNYGETNEDNENEEDDSYENANGFEDGTYSATVDYYNPETGYSTTYNLEVEVEDNHITIIYFPNGGYLDDDHIYPGELDEEGFVSIEGEEGKTYDIQIDK